MGMPALGRKLFVFLNCLCLSVSICGLKTMKPKKKKLALPRRKWTINPVMRVKEPDKSMRGRA
jgi:hypothetical protein